jgi:TRAP-type C4-dicarboxylate transport system permease small subunit
MPNTIERLFRAMFLYTGLFWCITGLWGIPQAWGMWSALSMWSKLNSIAYSQAPWKGNEVYFTVVILLVYGSCLIVGWLCVNYFRKLASRQYQQIPGIAEMEEPKWHDTAVFATLLATGTGLYCLNLCFRSLPGLIDPFTMIGMNYGDMTGIAALDIWYYHWQAIFITLISLGFAILFLKQSGKVAARVSQWIDTTPPPPQEDEESPTEQPPTEGGTDEQAG